MLIEGRCSSGGGLGERDWPADLRLNLMRLIELDACASSSRSRLRPAGEICNLTRRDLAGATVVAPGPSRPVIAVGVVGPALVGVLANGLPAREPAEITGFGDGCLEISGLGLGPRENGPLLGVSVPLSFFP